MTTTAKKLLDLPPAQWNAAIADFPSSKRQEVQSDLMGLASRCAMLAAYIGKRGADGCGDNGHESAVKEANRQLARVRKALGYSYPKSGAFSF